MFVFMITANKLLYELEFKDVQVVSLYPDAPVPPEINFRKVGLLIIINGTVSHRLA